jgi:hypothetical protein
VDVIEVVLGEFVLRLDGTVVEVLHRTGLFHRFHVDHVAVDAKPRKDGSLRVHVGVDQSGAVIMGAKVDVPEARIPEVLALFEQAKARRTAT